MGMKQFLGACDNFRQYPKNTVQHDALEHNLNSYYTRLTNYSSRLFVDGDDAALGFLDLNVSESSALTTFQHACVENLGDLKEQLREALRDNRSEPLCRFIFIHARHARAKLNISHEMFCFLFSYLQVSPSFLDFVFPFGEQEHAQDFYFTGFKDDVRLQPSHRGPSLPQLGRSGQGMTIYFNLRSVEESPLSVDFRWSIRQAAIYHTFDFETGKSVWIVVKGNKEIKRRISGQVKTVDSATLCSVPKAFSTSLKPHLLLCDWSVENWRWYINDLEDSLRALTRSALSTKIDRPPSPPNQYPAIPLPSMSMPTSPRSPSSPFPNISRAGTFTSFVSPVQKQKTFSKTTLPPNRTNSDISRAQTIINESGRNEGRGDRTARTQHNVRGRILSFFKRFTRRRAGDDSSSTSEKLTEDTEPEDCRKEPEQMPPGINGGNQLSSEDSFQYSDLQRIQYIEEKGHEVSLVLQLNVEVLQELRRHYANILEHPDFPSNIRDTCVSDIDRFTKCVSGVEKDLRMQRSRNETLLRLLAERKQFLYGILQYQSMRSSEKFAMKAHESAMNMEALTNNMNDIAQKTKQETVSMRIITLVTLFFLPGTFIGTFMSTDIIKFDPNETQHFQWKGLKLYLAICIPMMLITFIAWFGVYKWVNREKKEQPEAATSTAYSNSV